jgi:mono/diheme cytochrome c family protein
VRADRFLRAGALVALSTTLTACDWFTTFRHQPRLEPWENMTISPDTSKKLYWAYRTGLVLPRTIDEDSVNLTFRGNPSESVPVTGTYLAPWQVSYAALPNVIDSIGNAVKNPVAPTPESLELGRKYYQINCAVCHGDNGMGAQTIVAQYGLAFPIATDMTKNRSDGYLYGMIRNGRGLMPSYNRIEEEDRWHVVNYVRGLQGRYAVAQGPVGFPGQTGDALPSATEMAPTRPSPFRMPKLATGMDVRGGAAGDAAAPAGQAKEKN